jgi:DNA-binding MarR family transcriptional regulator
MTRSKLKTKTRKPQQAATGTRPAVQLDGLLPLFDVGGRSYFGYRMVLAAKMFDRVVVGLLAEHTDVTLPQWRVLAQLGIIKYSTVRALADGAAVDRAEISRASRELVKRGLIRRREDPADLRSPVFSLTPAGRRLYTRVRKPISDFIVHLMDEVNSRDLAAADRVILNITRGCIKR